MVAPQIPQLAKFSHIVLAVVFRYREQPGGTRIANDFVTSAWGVDIYREG